MYANEAMNPNVIVCHNDSSLEEVTRLMWENDCGAIPVVSSKNKPVGMVTDRDVAMAAMLNHKPLWDITAKTITEHQRVYSALQNSTVEECLTVMEQNGIRRLPVVNEDDTLAGILSMGDAIAFASKKLTRSKQAKTVSFDNVMGMLKQVSAHHEVASNPPALQ